MSLLMAATKKFIAFLVRHEWIVLLLFVVFLLRIPTLFEPHWYGDEEIYLVMGQGLRKGLVFYRDIFDHKPPLIYVIAAIAQSVFWFRLILLFVHALSVIYFAKLSELLFRKKWAVVASTTLYGLLSTIPLLEGTIANGENFMTVPALIAMYLIYRESGKNSSRKISVWFVVGLLFSTAFLIKVPILFDLLAGGLFWWFFATSNQTVFDRFKRIFSRQTGFVLVGFLLPIALSIVYYYLMGAFEPYVRSALLQNIGYIQSWNGETSSSHLLANPLVWRLLLLIGFLGLLLMLGKKTLSRPTSFVSLWFLFSVYGALLSNRPYPHYLLQPLLPACFLLITVFTAAFERRFRNVFILLVSIVVGGYMIVQIGFGHYPTISYYRNFIAYALGEIDTTTYHNFFPSPLERNQKVATYLREHTALDERVFVWGEEPAIYDLADRLPVGKYIVSFHVRDFPRGFEETYQSLVSNKPTYIVVIPSQVPAFNALETMLATDYLLVETINDALIFKRVEPKLVFNSI